jgi:hypothetical protein
VATAFRNRDPGRVLADEKIALVILRHPDGGTIWFAASFPAASSGVLTPANAGGVTPLASKTPDRLLRYDW